MGMIAWRGEGVKWGGARPAWEVRRTFQVRRTCLPSMAFPTVVGMQLAGWPYLVVSSFIDTC